MAATSGNAGVRGENGSGSPQRDYWLRKFSTVVAVCNFIGRVYFSIDDTFLLMKSTPLRQWLHCALCPCDFLRIPFNFYFFLEKIWWRGLVLEQIILVSLSFRHFLVITTKGIMHRAARVATSVARALKCTRLSSFKRTGTFRDPNNIQLRSA